MGQVGSLPAAPGAGYLPSWQLPRLDFHQAADDSLRAHQPAVRRLCVLWRVLPVGKVSIADPLQGPAPLHDHVQVEGLGGIPVEQPVARIPVRTIVEIKHRVDLFKRPQREPTSEAASGLVPLEIGQQRGQVVTDRLINREILDELSCPSHRPQRFDIPVEIRPFLLGKLTSLLGKNRSILTREKRL